MSKDYEVIRAGRLKRNRKAQAQILQPKFFRVKAQAQIPQPKF